MSQLLQSQHSLVKFPSTRLLEADYGSIVAANPLHFQQLDSLLNQKDIFEQSDVGLYPSLVPPHQPIYKPVKSNLSRLEKVNALKAQLAHHIATLQRTTTCQQQKIVSAEPVVKNLLAAVKVDPASAAYVLRSSVRDGPSLAVVRKCRKLRCAGKNCGEVTLPFSKFCLQHQCFDCDQVLYRSCTTVDSNSLTQCNETVVDIFSDLPLCSRHTSMEGSVPSRTRHVPLEARCSGLPWKKVSPHAQIQPLQKKATSKLGITKIIRGKKGSNQVTKAGQAEETALTSSWNNSSKPVTPSKSLDDLLTLSSSLTVPVSKLDLLPLKADIGEIMMAGEGSSSDDQL